MSNKDCNKPEVKYPCTDADNVLYTGVDLPCSGVETSDSINEALVKMDEKLCDLQTCCDENASIDTEDTVTLTISGNGSSTDPLSGDVNVSSQPNNGIVILPDGLFSTNTIQQGVIYGGIVTWLQDYDYHISAAGYYINGIFYTSPATFVTLSPSDPTNDRIDTFIVDNTGSALVLEGTPAPSPAQAPLDPATQLELSLALVQAGTTEPTIATECVYQENTEWNAISSSLAKINPDSTANPATGTKSIEGTGVTTGDNIRFVRSGAFTPVATMNVMSFLLRSKAAWGDSTKRLNLQFYLAGSPVGAVVPIYHGTYGFDSTNVSSYQVVAIPLSHFGLIASTSVDEFRITASVSSGSIGWYIDDLCMQEVDFPVVVVSEDFWALEGNAGTNANNNFVGTTDNMALAFRTNNVEAGRFGTDGKFGLGTTLPTQRLSIAEKLWLYEGGVGQENHSVIRASTGQTLFIYGGTGNNGISLIPNAYGTTPQIQISEDPLDTDRIYTSWFGAGATEQVRLGLKATHFYINAVALDTSVGFKSNGTASVFIDDSRFSLSKGNDVASANDLVLGYDGNMFSITGSTQINAILSTNWLPGTILYLRFTGTPLIKHNTAGGAGTAKMKLAGNVDWTPAVGDGISFQFDGVDFLEVGRSLVSVSPSALRFAVAGEDDNAAQNRVFNGNNFDLSITGSDVISFDGITLILLAGAGGVNLTTTDTVQVDAADVRITPTSQFFLDLPAGTTGDYLQLVDSATGEAEWVSPGAGGELLTADNGLTENTPNNVQLGGTLIQETTVNCTANYTMNFTGARTGSSTTLSSTNTSSGHAIIGTANGAGYGVFGSGFRGVFGTASSGFGVRGNSTSGTALYSETATGLSLSVNHTPAAFNDVQNAVHINRFTSGNSGFGASGIGTAIQFSAPTTTSTAAVAGGQINWNWSDATHASRSGEFNFLLENNAGGLINVLEIRSTGIFILTQGLTEYADDAAAAVGGIPVNGLYRTGSAIKLRVS